MKWNYNPLKPQNAKVKTLAAADGTRAHVATEEVQTVTVVAAVHRTRPVEAVATPIARRATAEVAGVDKVIGITPKCSCSGFTISISGIT